MKRIVFLAMLVVIAGCGDETPTANIVEEETEMRPMTADDLDALTELGTRVSVSGYVLEQYEEVLILDLGDGIVRVALPDPVELLAGMQIHAAGRVEMYEDLPAIVATEWYYDSTAVPVRSE